jgi:hypothetical protein
MLLILISQAFGVQKIFEDFKPLIKFSELIYKISFCKKNYENTIQKGPLFSIFAFFEFSKIYIIRKANFSSYFSLLLLIVVLIKVYLNNTIYFGEFLKEDKAWRGNLNLVWGDILLERDPENGLEYLTLSISVKRTGSSSSKNSQQSAPQAQPSQPKTINRIKTGTQTSKLRAAASTSATTSSHMNNELSSPRVYARQPANLCPVEAYKLFKTRRPNNCLDRESPFYLAPNSKSKFTSKVWYKALAMSCQRLDALFYCLFKKAMLDINHLANLSEQEQQAMIEEAAAASQASNDVVVWKANKPNVVQQNANNQNGRAHGNQATPHGNSKKQHGNSKTINQMNYQQNQAASNNNAYQQSLMQQQQHHIQQMIATVPVQVQVQVQIQVQPPQIKQQQQHMVVNDAYNNQAIQLLV